MFKERAGTLQALSLTLDVLTICGAFGAALALREHHESIPLLGRIPLSELSSEPAVRSDYAVLLIVSVIAWVAALRRSGLSASHRAERMLVVLKAYLRALAWACLSTAAVIFALKLTPVSRAFFLYYFVLSFVFLTAKHTMVIAALRRLRSNGYNLRHCLVIGGGKPAAWFARIVLDGRHMGYNLIGLVLTRKILSVETFSIPVLGELKDLDQILKEFSVDEVFIVGGSTDLVSLSGVSDKLIRQGKLVSLVSTLSSGAEGVRGRVTEFAGVPMVSFGPMPRDEVSAFLKRALDVVVAATGLALALPLMIVVAFVTRLLDPGPVFFKQVRLGVRGKPFEIWKFRTMRVDAEDLLRQDSNLYARYVANDYKLPASEDPRISRWGAFLRRTSLDELPQLVNVLKGDMTLVGPRPIVPDELKMYAPYHDLFLAVRPGLTGHWQINGRSDVAYPERAHMDLDYVAGHSVGTDVSIIARTLPAVIRRKGAH